MFRKILCTLLIGACVFGAGAVSFFASNNDTEILPGFDFQQGDINLDRKVNIKDVTSLQKHLAKINTLADVQLDLADVDGIKGINIKDATHLQKWLAGLVEKLFAPVKETEPQTTTNVTNVVLTEPLTTAETATTESESISVSTDAATSTAVVTDPTETTESTSTAVVIDPTETTEPTSTAVVTDPTESTESTSTAVVTEPAETTEATKATETTRDPDKPIELPFVPAI